MTNDYEFELFDGHTKVRSHVSFPMLHFRFVFSEGTARIVVYHEWQENGECHKIRSANVLLETSDLNELSKFLDGYDASNTHNKAATWKAMREKIFG